MIAATALQREGDRTLLVSWNDGTRSDFDVRELRLECPCAVCVNEWTGKKMLDPSRVPESVRPVRLFSVGRYAIGIEWSDGHSTGIYGYDYLRRLAQARAAGPEA